MSVLRDQILRQYARKSVSIAEFAESSDYCGKQLYPCQRILLKLIFLEELEGWEEDILNYWIDGGRNHEIGISPNIRERIQYCRDNNFPHFNEIDLIGGRRSSKGFVTGLAVGKKVFDVQQIPDPGKHFNIDVDKSIYFTCVAASEAQAIKFQFADFYSTITRCKALTPYIGKAQEKSITVRTDADEANIRRMQEQGIKTVKDFSKLRIVPSAANADTIRGATSIALVFDEMAFMMPGESSQSAAKVYEAAEPSLAQFGAQALIFCNSSPYTKIGQFYEQVELASRGMEHSEEWYPMRFALTFPSWALYDLWWKDPERRFSSAIMVSPDWPDQLDPNDNLSKLDDTSLAKRVHERLEEKGNKDSYKVERRAQWAEVLDAYLDPVMIDRAFNGVKPDGEYCRRTNGGDYRYEFRFHLDPSSTTAGFGFAIGHTEDFPDDSGVFPNGFSRHVVFDLVHRWNPQDMGGTINYLQVQKELCHFIDVYRPTIVTADQYNSTALLQGLREYCRKRSIPTRIHEVTATSRVNHDRWEIFKTCLNLGLIHVPPDCINQFSFNMSEYASFELKYLQEVVTATTKRVDKQSEGPVRTKDVADCLKPDTEILTMGGWKLIGDVTKEDLVATRTQGGILEYHNPIALHSRFTDEGLYSFDNPFGNFAVTPRHNLYGRTHFSGKENMFYQVQNMPNRIFVPKKSRLARENEKPLYQIPYPIERIDIEENSEISDYCRCGCGEKTPIAKKTKTERKQFKGQPIPYLPHHSVCAWSPQQDAYLRKNYSTRSMAEMLFELGKTRDSVYNRARKLGLERGQIGDRVADRPTPLSPVAMEDFAAFVGIWLAEGKKKCDGFTVKITQKKKSGIEWIDALFARLNWPHVRNVTKKETEWKVKSYELREYLESLVEEHELKIPDDAFLSWPTSALESLFEGMCVGDGTFSRGNFVNYTTSSKRLADDFQRLLFHIGLSGRIKKVSEKGSPISNWPEYLSSYDLWQVSIRRSENILIKREDVSYSSYEGMVYCVTVPNNTILIRRNDVAMWIGNCIAEVTNSFLASFIADFKSEAFGQPMLMGSEGGYQIGGRTPGGPVIAPGGSRFNDWYGSMVRNDSFGRSRGIDPRTRKR